MRDRKAHQVHCAHNKNSMQGTSCYTCTRIPDDYFSVLFGHSDVCIARGNSVLYYRCKERTGLASCRKPPQNHNYAHKCTCISTSLHYTLTSTVNNSTAGGGSQSGLLGLALLLHRFLGTGLHLAVQVQVDQVRLVACNRCTMQR